MSQVIERQVVLTRYSACVLLLVSFAMLVLCLCPCRSMAEPTALLENDFLAVEFSEADGAIVQIRHKQRQLDLIKHPPEKRTPWAMLLGPLRLVSDFEKFELTRDAAHPEEITLTWHTPYSITVVGKAKLAPDADQIEFTCSAKNTGSETIVALRYPAIQGIGALAGDGADDRLLHSTAMGLVFRNPVRLFKHDSANFFERGPAVSRYPNGFLGSALQLMSYYVENRGGFYIATHDGRATDKDLNFFKRDADSLSCEISHFNWNATPGTSLELDYPVVVAALREGSWYEAANRYRRWATKQPWCDRGTRKERLARGDSARWLTEEIGAVGMWWPFREDIESAVTRTRALYGAPLLHLELWWQNEPSVRAARSEGDRFGPFYFPYLCLRGSKTFEARKGDMIFPQGSVISPEWNIMCAAQPEWRRVFLESAVDLVGKAPLRHSQIWIGENKRGCEADCLYYDIGPCAGIPTYCYAAHHDHPPGAGRGRTEALLKLSTDSQQAASKAKGAYVPIGTECISEPFVSCMDLYYPRNAGFGTEMELGSYIRNLTWLPDGKMEAVPLFSYVYHEYQGVSVQGIYGVNPWLVEVGGDYHTWAEARSILWGGLFGTFALPDGAEPAAERVRTLRSLVAARTGFAKEYLCYGRMQPPPPIECETFQLDHGLAEGGWYHKLRFSGDLKKAAEALRLVGPKNQEKPTDAESGRLSVEQWVADVLAVEGNPANQATIEVPAVVSAAYTSGEKRLGVLLVSVQEQPPAPVRLSLDPKRYQLAPGEYEARLVTMDGAKPLGKLSGAKTFEIALPAREAVLVEVTAVE